MRNYQRDDYTPWSLVIPVALAVMLGVLAADVVRLLVVNAMAKAALDELSASMGQQTTPGHLPARPNLIDPAAITPNSPGRYQSPPQLVRLPGVLEANRRGYNQACIGGSISTRVSNGWSDDTSTGKRQRCEATSP